MRRVFAAVCLLLALPGAASAADVRIEGSAVVYTAAPGEENRLTLGNGPTSPDFVFSDQNPATTVAAPCVREETIIRCPADGLTVARFDLGDGNDVLGRADDSVYGGKELPLAVAGGDGDDMLVGSMRDDVIDGGAGNDDIPALGGADKVAGGPGDDAIRGSTEGDTIDGGEGNDELNGMTGDDRLIAGTGRDRVSGSEGDDVIELRNGELDDSGADQVDCGEGASDVVGLDERDRILEWRQPSGAVFVVSSCERVEGQRKTFPIKSVGLFNPIGSRFRANVDWNVALPATITVEVFHRGRLVAFKRNVRRTGPRTRFVLARTAYGRRVRGSFVRLKLRATVRDSAGRTNSKTRSEYYSF